MTGGGTRKEEEGGRRKEEGGRRKEEGERRKEEGGRWKVEGGRRKEESLLGSAASQGSIRPDEELEGTRPASKTDLLGTMACSYGGRFTWEHSRSL